MPRNGSSIYVIPPGTEGFPDTTIESEKYNNYIHDVETDLNAPRPIIAGGTGSTTADGALSNLGAEKSSQQVTNYDSHVWYPGSFYSAIGATGAPGVPVAPAGQPALHPFVGWVVSSDPPASPPTNLNVVVHARRQDDTKVPGTLYVREKKAGVWGQWAIDGSGLASATPPTDPADGALWWDTESGTLYIFYRDIDSAAWVIACPQPDPELFLLKAGDTMTGQLTLSNPPVNDLDAANKKYVDGADAALRENIQDDIVPVLDTKVDKAGDKMTGDLLVTRAAAPTTGAVKFGSGGQAITYNGAQFTFSSEIFVNRKSNPANGLIFFGNTGNNYISLTGTAFGFTGSVAVNSNVSVGNALSVVHTSTFTNDITLTRGHQGRGDQGLMFLGNSGARYFFHDTASAQYTFVGGGIIVGGSESYKPGGGPWGAGSDARIKNVLGEYTQGLAAIKQITPKRYVYKGNDIAGAEAVGVKFPEQKQGGPNPRSQHSTVAENKQEFIGLVAQDVEDVMPEMVQKISAKIDGQEVTDYRRMDSNALTYALINAVKELAARVEELEGKKK